MLKTVIGLLTALFVAGFSPAYAQDSSSPIPSQTDFKAWTDARIGIVKAALQLTPEQEKLWPPVKEVAATTEEREHLLSLESAWIRFAAELESAEAFLNTMDEIDLQPYPPKAA